MDADGLGERGRRRHHPLDDELPPVPPGSVKNQDFGIAGGCREEEGLGERERDGAVRCSRVCVCVGGCKSGRRHRAT